MDTQQQTLDSFIKSRKRPTNEDGSSKKGLMNKNVGVNKPSRKLSFDGSTQQTIKKQKVSKLYINVIIIIYYVELLEFKLHIGSRGWFYFSLFQIIF